MYTPSSTDSDPGDEPKTHAAGSSYRNVPNVRTISMLGLGMLIGVAIGAGAALLAAPQSGEETRERLRNRVRHLRGKDDVWSRLRRELDRAHKVRQRRELEKRRDTNRKMLERERAERDAGVTVS
jgi:gas vesicle protein